MNRGIIVFLVGIVLLGFAALYALQQGPVLLLRAPAMERIAFVSDRGGQVNLWTMRTDGSDARPVTNDTADDQIPAWSPDGKELVSVSDRRNQTYQLFLSAWDGRYTHDLTGTEGTKDTPVWSSDGREVTFINGGKIFDVPRTGGDEEQRLPLPGMTNVELPGRSNHIYGSWSADGKVILAVQETDQGQTAYAVDRDVLESWEEGQLKTTGIVAARNIHVAWAPSGHQVAASYVDKDGTNGILVANTDALEEKDLFATKGNTAGPGKLAWSPDGKTIVCEMWTVEDGMPNRSRGIYTVDADGGQPKLLVKGDAREPCWSPDGKQIVYTTLGKKERRDIWRINADGTGALNLTKGRGDSYNPAWSPAARK